MYGLVLIRFSLAEGAVINTTTLPLHLLEDIHQSTQLAFHNYVTVLRVTGGPTLTLNKEHTPFKCDSNDLPSCVYFRDTCCIISQGFGMQASSYDSIFPSPCSGRDMVVHEIWGKSYLPDRDREVPCYRF